tara:strand:+ start:16593 stop:18305 length:1713 start_codon:yes stop_codon:yes gene_type:complete
MKISISQLNSIVGDLEGNADKIYQSALTSINNSVELLLTPELSLWGYPPKDLLLNSQLIDKQEKILNHLVNRLKDKKYLMILIGVVEKISDSKIPNLFNAIAKIDKNGWDIVARKQLIPSYDVFDEARYFRSSNQSGLISYQAKDKTWKIGLTICEDLWVNESIQGKQIHGRNPIIDLSKDNIDLLINLSASPFTFLKHEIRSKLARHAANKLKCPVVFVNQVGGNDELVFDGRSFVINSLGETICSLKMCYEQLLIWDTNSKEDVKNIEVKSKYENLFHVLVLGIRDYAKKCGFKSAVLGLSGGIDSALVAVLAVSAFGKENVNVVAMPSPWSSEGSLIDAKSLSNRLGLNLTKINISNLMSEYDNALEITLRKKPTGLTAENLQSRIRGTLLMALANQNNHLLLSTGNKSELAVGYCTLYGDMNGGLAVIGDIYKTNVFKLCEWLDGNDSLLTRKQYGLNPLDPIIGKEIRSKPPSAELREGQLDTDSLPDYQSLDLLLKKIIEKRISEEELIKGGHSKKEILKIINLIKKSEFKRKQAPPVIKVSSQSFGSDWRLPIASCIQNNLNA